MGRICKGCGIEFKKTNDHNRLYCASACKIKFKSKIAKEKEKIKLKEKAELDKIKQAEKLKAEKEAEKQKRLERTRERNKKICPRCQAEHYKRGAFCSASCGNVREISEEERVERRKVRNAYYETPEGEAHKKKVARHMRAVGRGEVFDEVDFEDFLVDIPVIRDDRDYDDFFEGWDNGENW